MSKELRHDRHTVSLLTDHLVFSPKYRGKVLVCDVGMVAEAIIRKTCKELDIEIIDMALASAADDWKSQVMAGQIFDRIALTVTSLGMVIHPMSQILEVPEVKAEVAKLSPEENVFLTAGMGFASLTQFTLQLRIPANRYVQ